MKFRNAGKYNVWRKYIVSPKLYRKTRGRREKGDRDDMKDGPYLHICGYFTSGVGVEAKIGTGAAV